MDKTLINHLEVSLSNLNNLSYSLFSTVRSLVDSGRSVDSNELIELLKSFKSQFTITLDDFQMAIHEVEIDDPIYSYLDYYDDALTSAYSSIDELTYLIEKEFDTYTSSLKLLIKSTLSSVQDVIFISHEWFSTIRDNNETTDNQKADEKDDTEDEVNDNEDTDDYPKDEPDEDFYPQEK